LYERASAPFGKTYRSVEGAHHVVNRNRQLAIRERRAATECLESRALLTASAELLKDINESLRGREPTALFSTGTTAYYAAFTPEHGCELWRSDGTAAGTFLLKDIAPGPRSSGPSSFAQVGTIIYFSAYTETTGYELWKTDGTPAGTNLVIDIVPGRGSSNPSQLKPLGTSLIFFASTPSTGCEPWRSNGTAAGTQLIVDFLPGPIGSFEISNSKAPAATTANAVVFIGQSGKLCRTDGTASGTYRLSLDGAQYLPRHFVSNGSVAIAVSQTGSTLVSTDGTFSGTKLFSDPQQAAGDMPIIVGAYVYYYTQFTGGSNLARKPISTPSAISTPIPLPQGVTIPRNFMSLGTTLVFSADSPTGGRNLYSVGPTATSARLVFDYPDVGFYATHGMAVGSLLFFREEERGKLWRTDLTSAGTFEVSTFLRWRGTVPDDQGNLSVGLATRLIYVSYEETLPTASEIWASDGTVGGSRQVLPTGGPTLSSDVFSVGRVGGNVFYSAKDFVHGTELWKSDGSTANTSLAANINPGNYSSFAAASGAIALSNRLVFGATTPSNGNELYMIDAASNTVSLVLDIEPGSTGSMPQQFAIHDGIAYFCATTTANGAELWRTDGTATGTFRITDIAPGPASSSPTKLTPFKNKLYFTATNSVGGAELWVTDGSVNGATQLIDINSGSASSSPDQFAVAGDLMYFVASDALSGREPWVTNGTSAGTIRVADLIAGTSPSNPSDLTAIGDWLYFSAATVGIGVEPYRLRVGSAAPELLGDLNIGASQSYSRNFMEVNGVVYFTATTLDTDCGVFRITPTGIAQVSFLGARSGSTIIDSELLAHNGQLFFTTTDSLRGREVGVMDLRPGAAAEIIDVYIGFSSSDAKDFHVAGNSVVFSARTEAVGTELFRINDTFSPYVIRSAANVETRQSVEVDWSEPSVLGTGTVATLVSLPSNTPVAGVTVTPTLSSDGKRTTFTFSAALPDGNYRLQLSATGLRDPASNFAPAQTLLDFHILAGDANRDRSVNFSDLLVLASNYNQSSRTFSQGDFNYDGSVNFNDLLILASRYNQTLATTDALPATKASARKRQRGTDVLI
jgi:ELWxxDGT repeat protein